MDRDDRSRPWAFGVRSAAGQSFVGVKAVSSGTNTVTVTATDGSGNTQTKSYETATGASRTFTHDLIWNLAGDGTRTFELDAENRLIGVTNGTHRSEDVHRLQVIDGRRETQTVYGGKSLSSASTYGVIGLTPLGLAFIRACRRPRATPMCGSVGPLHDHARLIDGDQLHRVGAPVRPNQQTVSASRSGALTGRDSRISRSQ